MKQKQIQHLYWRAGFGVQPNQYVKLLKLDRHEVVDALFSDSKTMSPLKIDTSELKPFWSRELLKDKANQKEFRKISTKKLKSFNKSWIERLAISEEVLREKMTLFWANHFVCRDQNIFHVQQYNNILRTHALGHFGDFVKAISKEPAMLKYLNNKQNRKQKPNENFARELMELFTLGEGHYSEQDVKESARAFTGYNHNFAGEFVLRRLQHDYEFKSFLGHKGRYDGDDIIDIILEQKQCARFICKKIYKYFVNDNIDEKRIEELTSIFFKNYDIEQLMRHIFMSDWFYAGQHIGAKIKSPIEFLVGMIRTVPVTFKDTKDVLKLQKLLGQILLNPPNVSGWEGGKSWIDSNTIMLRLKLPSIILANAKISIRAKGEFEDAFETYYSRQKKNKFVKVNVHWETFDKQYKLLKIADLRAQIIVPEISNGTKAYIETLSQSSKQDLCIQLMSLPEYQMC
ncbi:DUF1800 domain-containing protein [Psychroserpens sp. MEBiC05023]